MTPSSDPRQPNSVLRMSEGETTMERQNRYSMVINTRMKHHMCQKQRSLREAPQCRGVISAIRLATGENALEKSVNIDHSQLSCPKKTIILNNLYFLNWKCELGSTGYYLPIITQCSSSKSKVHLPLFVHRSWLANFRARMEWKHCSRKISLHCRPASMEEMQQ